MSKPPSRQPGKEKRKARRSPKDSAAVAASNGVHDDPPALPSASLANSQDAAPQLAHPEQTYDQTTTANPTDVPAREQAAAMISVPSPDPAASAPAKIDGSEVLRPAEDYQTRVLEDVEAAMHAALDDAKDATNTRTPTDKTSSAMARGNEGCGAAGSRYGFLAALATAAAYRAKAFELMDANMNSNFEYARQLVRVRTPSEFVKLSSTHARKQFELALKQTSELRSLAHM